MPNVLIVPTQKWRSVSRNEYITLAIGTGFRTVIGRLGQYWQGRLEPEELFDHKLRIEKEHQIYADLWGKLFEFRRVAHGLVDNHQNEPQENPHQRFVKALNAYQAAVRRNEPFIFPAVYESARAIVSEGWKITGALEELRSLAEYRGHVTSFENDERVAEKMIAEDDVQKKAIVEIDTLFPLVRDAIRTRITRKAQSVD